MQYRRDVDGLRAIAVLAVIGFHFAIPYLDGGYLGVDVFFVISGYLITGLITAELADNRFSLASFFARRVRRILPAMLVMIVLALFVGFVVLMPGNYAILGESAVASALGLGNLFFFSRTGYFDPEAALQPLLHLWSLGLEEQFYIVWPLLLVGAWRITGGDRRRIAGTVTAFCFATIAMAVWLTSVDPKQAFYAPYARAWELGLGALASFTTRSYLSAAKASRFAWLGAALVVLGISVASEKLMSPVLATLLPSLGVFLILAAGPKSSLAPILSFRPLVLIGLASYSLYLWHWPVLVFFRHFAAGRMPDAGEASALLVLTAALSGLSWRYVEQPIRRVRLARSRVLLLGAATAVCVASVGFLIGNADGWPTRIPEKARDISSFNTMWAWRCPELLDIPPLGRTCVFGAPWSTAKHHAVLWGDSHAGHLAVLLNRPAREADFSVAVYLNCSPNLDGISVKRLVPATPTYDVDCAKARRPILSFLQANKVDLVILTGAWSFMFDQLYVNNPEEISSTLGKRLVEQTLFKTIELVSAPGRQVAIVADPPIWPTDPIPCEMSKAGFPRRLGCPARLTIARQTFEQRQRPEYGIIKRIAERTGATAYYPADGLCNVQECITHIDGEILYADRHHLRRNLSLEIISKMTRMMGFETVFRHH